MAEYHANQFFWCGPIVYRNFQFLPDAKPEFRIPILYQIIPNSYTLDSPTYAPYLNTANAFGTGSSLKPANNPDIYNYIK